MRRVGLASAAGLLAVLLPLAAAGCRGCRIRPPFAGGSDGGGGRAAAERHTTAPEIALANLDGSIGALEARYRSPGWDAHRSKELVDLLLTRGEFRSRVSDYERAAEVADAAAARPQPAASDYLARASVASTLHRFREAARDLDRAEALGADSGDTLALRATVLDAQGRSDDARAMRERLARARPTIASLGLLAVTLGESGDVDGAQERFDQALASYRDVSPLPVAWLHFQRGRILVGAGQLERARESFERACFTLPPYATATVHLAEVEAALGRRERAIALLTPLAERCEDPDAAAQLARLLAEAGQPGQSAVWRGRVEERYAVLLARHPEAFADHAAEFWLAAGRDPRRALAWAKRNVDNRRTRGAYLLMLLAARAAGDGRAAREAQAALARAVSVEQGALPAGS